MHDSGNVLLALSKNLRSSKLHLSKKDTQAEWGLEAEELFM
jgi:hypothetical protein